MVNMLQLVINQNKCIDERDHDETLHLWGMGYQPLGETNVKQGVQNKDLLYDDGSISNAFNSSDVEIEDLVDDGTKDLFLPNVSNEVKELMENRLDLFIQNEGPHQIMNLLLEK